LEQGRSAESALGDAEWGLPSHLAGLLAAAIRTGDCGAVLSELADIRAGHDEAWRETRSAVAYPLLMLLLTAGVFVFLLNYLAPQLVQFYEEFELPLPASTSSLSWFRTTGQWLAAGWVAALVLVALSVRSLAPWSLYCRARSSLPVFGKIFLWSAVGELLGLVRVLVHSGLPLVEAWRLAAAGLRDGHVADVARRIARSCEQGGSLAKALRDESAMFLPTLVPIIDVGEQRGDLPAALAAAAGLVGDRSRSRTQLIRQLGPPILFLIIATFVVSLPVALIVTPMPTCSCCCRWRWLSLSAAACSMETAGRGAPPGWNRRCGCWRSWPGPSP
jgi:type II secretory pathway component PulF